MKFIYHVGRKVDSEKEASLVLKYRAWPDWVTIYIDKKAEFSSHDDAVAFAKKNGLQVISETLW